MGLMQYAGGNATEIEGKLTDDKRNDAGGKAQQIEGDRQDRADDARDNARGATP
jgi:uncharacterized protein YjbJ (UPF0337 family)